MKKVIVWSVASLMLFQSAVFAQLSTRDADIDLQLNAGAGGVAPATGSSAPASGVTMPGAFAFPPMLPSAKVVFGQTDKKARVYDLKGKVTWIKQGTPIEKKLRVNDILNQGDIIQTEEKSSASIAFDDSYMNAVHLPENTRAVIESIEPTNVRIENGAIYSAVNGLPQGGSWKITTPAAVAAVRGTLYIVRYQAASGNFYAATVDIPDDGKLSAIEIQEIAGSQSANIPEGKEISLVQGQAPSQDLVGELDPESLQEILSFFESLASERELQEEGYAPPTGSESSSGPESDNQGSDNSSQPDLDPSDTEVLNEDDQDEPLESPIPGEDGPVIDDPKEDNKCEQDDRNHHDRDDRWDHDRGHGDDHGRGGRNDRDRDEDWNDDRDRREDHDHRDRDDRDHDDRWNDDRGRQEDHDHRDRSDHDNRWNDDRDHSGDHDHNDRYEHDNPNSDQVDGSHCESPQDASEVAPE